MQGERSPGVDDGLTSAEESPERDSMRLKPQMDHSGSDNIVGGRGPSIDDQCRHDLQPRIDIQ